MCGETCCSVRIANAGLVVQRRTVVSPRRATQFERREIRWAHCGYFNAQNAQNACTVVLLNPFVNTEGEQTDSWEYMGMIKLGKELVSYDFFIT